MKQTSDPEPTLVSTGTQQPSCPPPSTPSTNHWDDRGNTARHLFNHQKDNPVCFSIMARPQLRCFSMINNEEGSTSSRLLHLTLSHPSSLHPHSLWGLQSNKPTNLAVTLSCHLNRSTLSLVQIRSALPGLELAQNKNLAWMLHLFVNIISLLSNCSPPKTAPCPLHLTNWLHWQPQNLPREHLNPRPKQTRISNGRRQPWPS